MKMKYMQGGFSLVEIMVGMVVGIIVVFGVTSVYISSKRNHVQNNQYNDLLESSRYAVNVISNDIKHAGFLGGISDFSAINLDDSIDLDVDCGMTSETDWVYDLSTYGSVQLTSNATPTQANTAHKCISVSEYLPGSNAVVIKRAYGLPVTSLKLNTVYLRSDNSSSCLWFYSSATTTPSSSPSVCPSSDYNDWQYVTNIYYIRSYAKTAGDGIPTLCKKTLSSTTAATPKPTMTEMCLAEGVEYFRILFGIDSDAVPDGNVNTYTATPSASDLGKIVTAKLYLLTRSVKADANYKNVKTYNLGGMTFSKNDNYYRKVFTTTVSIPNNVSKLKL